MSTQKKKGWKDALLKTSLPLEQIRSQAGLELAALPKNSIR